VAASNREGKRPACKRHPGARAGWACDACTSLLCADCTAEQRTGIAVLNVCCLCGSIARRLTLRRSEMMPFFDRLLGAPKFPLTSSGLTAMAVVAGVFTLNSYGSAFMLGQAIYVAIIVRGIYWGYIFSLIRSTGRGSRVVSTPDFTNITDDIIMPAVRGVVSALVVWLPAMVYVALTHEAGVFGVIAVMFDPAEILSRPLLMLLLVAGMAYLPMAMLCAATEISFFEILNPFVISRAIGRVGSDYWITAGAMGLLLPLMLVADMIGAKIAHEIPIFFLPRFVGFFIGMYVPFVMARVLGLLLYVHGDVLDWGTSEEYEEPMLPGASPRGEWNPPPMANVPRARRLDYLEAADLAPGAADQGELVLGAPGRLTPALDLARPVVDAAPAMGKTMSAVGDGGGMFDDIREAIAVADFDKALRLYAHVSKVPEGALAPGHHFTLGQAAAKVRDFNLAVRAFEEAAQAKTDPVAPKALVMLAQVYGDGLGNAARAESIYRAVVREFASTKSARFAEQKLRGKAPA